MKPIMFSSPRRRRITVRHRPTIPRRTSPRRLRSRILARRRTPHVHQVATVTVGPQLTLDRDTLMEVARTTADHAKTVRKRGRIRRVQAPTDRQRPRIARKVATVPPLRTPRELMHPPRSITPRHLPRTIREAAAVVRRTTPVEEEETAVAAATLLQRAVTTEVTAANLQLISRISSGGFSGPPLLIGGL